jgi:hypothetical protein
MNKVENRLSQLDIKYITKILGRVPTDIELKFIELILSNELENRDYLRILNLLNIGAKREVNNQIEINEEYNLYVNTGFKIINQKKLLLIDRDETKYINKINNLYTILDDIVINSSINQNIEMLFRKEIDGRKNSGVIGGRFINDEQNGIIFSSSIGLKVKDKNNLNIELNNSLIYKIKFGKRSFKKYIYQIQKVIDKIYNEEWFIFAKAINWNGLGIALIDLIREINHGINVIYYFSEEADLAHFSDDKLLSALIVIKQDSETNLNAFCKENDLRVDAIGTLTAEPTLQITNKNNTLTNLPVAIFDLQYNVNVQHLKQSKIELKAPVKVLKKYTSTSFSNQLLKLFTIIIKDDVLWKHSVQKNQITTNYSSYGLLSSNDSIDDQIVLTQADKNHVFDASPRLSGTMSIANAMRRLSCTGAKPKAAIVQNIFPQMNEKSLWKASELLQGQEEAIRELEVEIGNRSIDTFEDSWYQNISAIGIHHQNSFKMDISFKQVGHFISLLGSHRGELALYFRKRI